MSNNSDISNESKDIGGDIEIQDDQVNHFFFMDSDEEKKTYGTSSNANLAMSGNILKDAAQQKVGFNIGVLNIFILGSKTQIDCWLQVKSPWFHWNIHKGNEKRYSLWQA